MDRNKEKSLVGKIQSYYSHGYSLKKMITDIVNSFNNHFVKVPRNTQSSIQFSKNKYFHYLPPINIESFFITDCSEVFDIISSLKLDKRDGPNSIPTKVLKLLDNTRSTSNPL